jgi:hypothetical protein
MTLIYPIGLEYLVGICVENSHLRFIFNITKVAAFSE